MDVSISSDRLADVLPDVSVIERCERTLIQSLQSTGIGLEKTTDHLNNDIVPALNRSSQSPRYYGFVTGGATPAATLADNMVTRFDQSLSVHLPKESIATNVEDSALRMVCDLLRLSQNEWSYRTFTTGATASNILGLACGREWIVQAKAGQRGTTADVGEVGLLAAMKAAGVEYVQVLTTVPHSSLAKAASIVGLGRCSVQDVSRSDERHRFDLEKLRSRLSDSSSISIVAVSCAEVNTGLFATTGEEMQAIRDLCTKHGAWLHVDAAFGLMARVLNETDIQYRQVATGVDGLHFADSITGDAHKLLNVVSSSLCFAAQLVLGIANKASLTIAASSYVGICLLDREFS